MKTNLKTISKLCLLLTLLVGQSFAQKKRLMVQQGHSSFIETVAFSPDDSKIFTGSVDASFKIWDTKTGKLLQVVNLDNPLDYLSEGVFYLKNRKQAIIKTINNIQLWDLDKQKRLQIYKNISSDELLKGVTQDASKILLVNPKGLSKARVIGNQPGQVVLDVAFTSGLFRKTREFEGVLRVNDGVFSPDEKQVLIGLSNGAIKLLDIKTNKILKTFKKDSIQIKQVRFSRDGLYIYSLNANKVMRVWNVQTEQLGQSLELPKTGDIEAWWPERQLFVSSKAHNRLALKDLNTGQLIQEFVVKNGASHYYPVLSKDQSILLSVNTHFLMVWEVKTGKLLYEIPGSAVGHIPVQYASDRTKVIQITLSGKPYSFDKPEKVTAMKGKRDNDPNIYLKDAKTQQLKATIYTAFPNKKAWVITTPDGRYDANQAGLQYLHYVQNGTKILSLPKRDPKRVKGLLQKLLE